MQAQSNTPQTTTQNPNNNAIVFVVTLVTNVLQLGEEIYNEREYETIISHWCGGGDDCRNRMF